ncbi:hypothetical protein RND71_035968 [Anisodus tanguticus]|uniref:BZIP domain-containing protein n=1 Tax=Anisodus tanguticus TaxID=243964 RepID=A0AAE1R7W2_9SOLA|nr:hypothetical protein RND71_035968 [Anisodus tanguticus]
MQRKNKEHKGARITIKSEDEQEIAIQAEDESELQTSFVCALNYPPVTSSKSRQELTEYACSGRKEGRRLHRVLANRESARRTIRRRQILGVKSKLRLSSGANKYLFYHATQEELTRKAADLALENENLKKNKELAAAEYNSLKNNNNNLRVQMAKIVKAEVEETDDDSKSIPVEAPNSTTSPTFLHNQSSKVPLLLSTVFQPLDGLTRQFNDDEPPYDSSICSFLPLADAIPHSK